jgi:ATP-NAD kinase N-terminal domain
VFALKYSFRPQESCDVPTRKEHFSANTLTLTTDTHSNPHVAPTSTSHSQSKMANARLESRAHARPPPLSHAQMAEVSRSPTSLQEDPQTGRSSSPSSCTASRSTSFASSSSSSVSSSYSPLSTISPRSPPSALPCSSTNAHTHEQRHLERSAPTHTRLRWRSEPRTVLLVKKRGDEQVTQQMLVVADYLQRERGMRVLVEPEVSREVGVLPAYAPCPPSEGPRVRVQRKTSDRWSEPGHESATSPPSRSASPSSSSVAWSSAAVAAAAAAAVSSVSDSVSASSSLTLADVDLVVCLGGDGTLMHANSLFPRQGPPSVCFNLGSLGFLTPFSYVLCFGGSS